MGARIVTPSTMYIGNASDFIINAGATQEQVRLKAFEGGLNISNLTDFGGNAKQEYDYSDRVTGFVRMAPHTVRAFDLPQGAGSQVYVTITSVDDKVKYCENYCPPRKHCVILSADGTVHVTKIPGSKEKRIRSESFENVMVWAGPDRRSSAL